jgi:PPOX class probable F420-dependent enzyme
MAALEGRARELLEDKNYAHLALLRPDGTIQAVVVWIHVDDQGRPIANAAEGRSWPKNLRREGRLTISVHDQDNPYEYVSIVARLAGDTHEGADEVIDMLAKKYLDADSYPYRQEGEVRVTFTFEPERVTLARG